jgi:molecular chaperone DnaK
MSTNPIAVGIDLGTTNSVVAVAQGGQPRVLTTAEGMALIPSVVSFTASGQTLVGAAARSARTQDPENTVFSVKRLMGRPYDAEEVRRAAARFAFSLERGAEQSVVVRTRAGTHTLPELSALVLREVRRVAEAALGQQLGRAVITVPANFNELQRSATKLAGQIADLDVARILNEPTAAALAYGYGRGTKERIAVYDFGGGTFDVTLLELSGNVFEVLATAGDTFLGGDDIDAAMAEGLADAATKSLRFDARKDRRAYEMLRLAAEQAKIDLSATESAQIRVPAIGMGPGGRALEFRSKITRAEFETVAQPFVQRTVDVCAEAMRLAGLKSSDFGAIILVGGSSQIPLVRRAERDFFKAEPHTSLPPETVVATGAAVLAEALGGKRTKITGHSKVGKLPSAPPPGSSLPPGQSDSAMTAVGAPQPPSGAGAASNMDFPAVKGAIPGPPQAPTGAGFEGSSMSSTGLPAVKSPGPAPSSRAATDPGVNRPATAKEPSSMALPAVKTPAADPQRAWMRKTGDLGLTPPKPPVPAVAPNASVTGLPAVKVPGSKVSAPPDAASAPGHADVNEDLEAPTGTALPALVRPGLPAVPDHSAGLPSVAIPGAPAQRGRVSTEPHGVAREEPQEHHSKPEFAAPRGRARTITSAAAAVPPPAPTATPASGIALPAAQARAPVGPSTPSSIAPPKASDFSWGGNSERPSALKPNALVPLDEDDEEIHTSIKTPKELDEAFPDTPTGILTEPYLSPSVADLPAVQPPDANLPANRPVARMDPPIIPSHRITKSLVDLPNISPPKPPVDLPSVAAVNSKIPTLTQLDNPVQEGVGLPSILGSNIATQPSIQNAVVDHVMQAKPAMPEPNEGVTTLKRISTLITEADDTDAHLPAVSAPKPIERQPPPVPPAPPTPPVNPAVVGRRTAVMNAAPPPPPPAAPPPVPTAQSAQPRSTGATPIAGAFDLNGEASLLTSPRDLFATLGFDNTAAPEPAPIPAPVTLAQPNSTANYGQFEPPPPPIAMPSALSTAPIMGGGPAPSPMAPAARPPAPPPYQPPPYQTASQAAPYQPQYQQQQQYQAPPSQAQAYQPPMPAPMPAPMPPPMQYNSTVMGSPPAMAGKSPYGSAIAPPVAPLLLDVTPQSLRVETVGGLSQMVIGRNSTIPLEQTREFATAYDNQSEVRIRISQGESSKFAENQPLGELELVGLRAAPRGDVRIAVTFELDADGTLQVRARDAMTGLQTEARINLLTIPGAPATEAMAQRQRGA